MKAHLKNEILSYLQEGHCKEELESFWRRLQNKLKNTSLFQM